MWVLVERWDAASHAKHVAAANDLPATAGKPVGGALIGFTWEQISPGRSNRCPDIQRSLKLAQTHFQSAVPRRRQCWYQRAPCRWRHGRRGLIASQTRGVGRFITPVTTTTEQQSLSPHYHWVCWNLSGPKPMIRSIIIHLRDPTNSVKPFGNLAAIVKFAT